MDGHTEIRIRGPIPADLASTLLALVGGAYPSAKAQSAAPGDALSLLIPDEDRPVHPDSPPTGHVAEVFRIDAEGLSFSTPYELASAMTQVLEDAFAEFEPENYLETKLSVPTAEGGERRYAMIFARTPGQSPHELRQAAERRAEAAEAEVQRLQAELARLEG